MSATARPKSATSNSSVKKAPSVTTTTTGTTVTPPTPTGTSVGKLSKRVSKSDIDTPVKVLSMSSYRLSADHKPSSRSVNSKPAVDSGKPVSGYSKTPSERRASKLSLTPEMQNKRARAPTALDLQAQLMGLQEELKKAKDQLDVLEKEKTEVIEELKEARKTSEDTFDKLSEALAGQKRAEEIIEIEKFRAIEIEQAGIEAADRKRDEWNKQIEELRIQQASDADALLSTIKELKHVKEELVEISDAKNQAAKETKFYSEKAELLTAEIASLKALLDSKTKAASDSGDMVLGLKSEVELLKLELDRSKASTEELEANMEKLNSELSESKMAQAYSNNLVQKRKLQVEELEYKVQEANAQEQLVSESLNSVSKKLEVTENLLIESKHREESLTENVAKANDAVEVLQAELEVFKEAEVKALGLVEVWKQKAKELEQQAEEANATEKTALDQLSSVKIQLEETRGLLQEANKKVDETGAAAEQLNVELEASRLAEAYAKNLVDEWKQKVIESEDRAEEANQSEKGMKELLNLVRKELETSRASLKEAENRAATAEADAFEMAKKIETLKIQLETAQEEQLKALDKEKLTASNVQALLEEKSKLINELENSKYDEEKSKKAMESLAAALHEVSVEAREAKENFLARQAERETYETNEKTQLIELLKTAESEVTYMNKVLGEAKAESMKLKESLLVSESEMRGISKENEVLRTREADAREKVEELSRLLEEAAAKKTSAVHLENAASIGFLTCENHENSISDEAVITGSRLFQNMNEDEAAVEIDEKDYSPEKSLEESVDEEIVDSGESIAVIASPTRQQKKKKVMLGRIGSLLKKNSSNSQKS